MKKKLLLLLAAGLMLGACSNDASSSSSSSSSEEPSSSSSSSSSSSETSSSESSEASSESTSEESSAESTSESSEESSSEESSESSTTPIEKVTPTVTIYYGETENTENGGAGSYTTDTLPDFSYKAYVDGVEVTDTGADAYYQNNDTSTRLEGKPSTAGTFSYNVVIPGNDTYTAVTRWVWFTVTDSSKITLSITITVNDTEIADDAESRNAGTFAANNLPTFSYKAYHEGVEVEDASIATVYLNEAEQELTGVPSEPGIYSYHVRVREDDTYNALDRYVWYTITDASKSTPTVTIYYGESENTENGGAGTFTSDAIPDFTFKTFVNGEEVTDTGADYYYQNNDTETRLDSKPTSAGTYSFNVSIAESDSYTAVTRWVWFIVTDAAKITPTVTILVGDIENTANGPLSGDWNGDNSISLSNYPSFSYTAYAGDTEIPDSYVSAYFVDNSTEAVVEESALQEGKEYAYHVHIAEGDTFTSLVRYVVFTVAVETVSKVEPTVTILIGDIENTANSALSGSWSGDNSISLTNYPAFSYTAYAGDTEIPDSYVTAFFMLNDGSETVVEESALEVGKEYAYHVHVAEGDTFTSLVRWVVFNVVA